MAEMTAGFYASTRTDKELGELVMGCQPIPRAERFMGAVGNDSRRADLPKEANVLGTDVSGTEPATHDRRDQSSTQSGLPRGLKGNWKVTY